jgi:phosphonopyruvate decarboxylase
MPALLDALELPWAELPTDPAAARAAVANAAAVATDRGTPYVLLVPKGTFAGGAATTPEPSGLPSREQALVELVPAIGDDAILVATTGMLGRELAEYRQRTGTAPGRDFLTVGGMGHASSIALGMALAAPHREVWCLDGDGALLMHLGALAVIGRHAPARLFHVVFNNGVHDSVGSTPTAINAVDVPAAARALGYRYAVESTVDESVARLRAEGGPALLELRVRPGARPDVARPADAPSGQTFAEIWR